MVQKALLCGSSSYFKAALNGSFIEGESQKVELDDEDPEVFRTYVAWLYQGYLMSSEIRKEFPEPEEFEAHIVAVMIFADKRGIPDLFDDTVSMLVNYLSKTGLAARATIEQLFLIANTTPRRMLISDLVFDEIHFRTRIESQEIEQFPRAFVGDVLREAIKDQKRDYRTLGLHQGKVFCKYFHVHAKNRSCSSQAKNVYDGPATVVLPEQRPYKKRKTSDNQ